MTRRFLTAGSVALVLAAAQGTQALAQWGYPVGYGGYGWGGWGGQTVQGSIAQGLGTLAMGAGYYNQQTAVARSINTDTVMRWNQYVYESQMNANRLHHGKLALEKYNNIKDVAKVQKRLRDSPEPADVYRGDALNVALDEVNDPRVYTKALQGTKAKIGGETIRNIPFHHAAEAITTSFYQIARGKPPASLMRPEFASDRETIKALGDQVRKQTDEDKNPDPETINKLLAAIHAAEVKADAILPKNTRQRNEADRYLKALHGLVAMLQTPAIDVLLAGTENRPDATLGELLNFMRAFNLRFGVASTPQQRQTYDSLYPKLVALRDEVAPALATSAPAPTSGQEAGEFFSGMSYDDLKKKAPNPPGRMPRSEFQASAGAPPGHRLESSPPQA